MLPTCSHTFPSKYVLIYTVQSTSLYLKCFLLLDMDMRGLCEKYLP